MINKLVVTGILISLTFAGGYGRAERLRKGRSSTESVSGRAIKTIETDCLILVRDQVQIAAQRSGKINLLHVRIGDDVKEGQTVVEFDSRLKEAQLDRAKAVAEGAKVRAENDASIKSAEADMLSATKENELLEEVKRTPFLERFRAETTLKKSQAELELAKATHQELKHAQAESEAELKAAKLEVEQGVLHSPVDGTVVQQSRYSGEWCNQGEPIIKILRMDRLMLQGIVNVRQIAPHQIVGMQATATFQVDAEKTVTIDDLRISKCNPEIDLDGNYLVWTFIDNQKVNLSDGQSSWLYRPGLNGTLVIGKGKKPAPTGAHKKAMRRSH